MWKVTAPNGAYNGVSAGVAFVDGVGETDNPLALTYFRRHGYTVEEIAETKKPTKSKKKD